MTKMKKRTAIFTVSALSLTLLTSTAFAAQDHHDDRAQDHRADQRQNDHHDQGQYVRHNDWKRGHRMNHDDWSRGQQIDYRQHHLNAPRRGYEWREVDGNYVMAAIATGLIVSVIAANGH